jgi:type VI secretion system protein ImpK
MKCLSMRTLLCETAHQITLLQQGVIPDSLEELRNDCEELVRTFEAALIAQQLAPDVIRDAVHAQCALLNQAVTRSLPPEMQARWGNAALQMGGFCQDNDSEAISARMVTRLQAATPELVLLECYSIILELGLRGCHAGSDELERNDLLTALYTKIAALQQISARHRHPDRSGKRRSCRLLVLVPWIITTLTAAAIVLLYLLLSHVLDPELYRL